MAKFAMYDLLIPDDKLPEFKRREYSDGEKAKLVNYMSSIEPNAAGGYIWDCVQGKEVKELEVGYDDGKYMWSARDIYHLEHYDAAVTDEFFDYVINLRRQ